MRLAKKRPVVSSTLLEMRMSLLLGRMRSFCQRWFTFWMMGCNQCVKCCIYWDCYQTECHFAALPKSNSGWQRLWLTSKSDAILLSCKHCRRWLQQLFTPTGGCTMLIVVGRSKFLIRVVQWLSLSHKSPAVWAVAASTIFLKQMEGQTSAVEEFRCEWDNEGVYFYQVIRLGEKCLEGLEAAGCQDKW